jgi:hypothetical protein
VVGSRATVLGTEGADGGLVITGDFTVLGTANTAFVVGPDGGGMQVLDVRTQ